MIVDNGMSKISNLKTENNNWINNFSALAGCHI